MTKSCHAALHHHPAPLTHPCQASIITRPQRSRSQWRLLWVNSFDGFILPAVVSQPRSAAPDPPDLQMGNDCFPSYLLGGWAGPETRMVPPRGEDTGQSLSDLVISIFAFSLPSSCFSSQEKQETEVCKHLGFCGVICIHVGAQGPLLHSV